MQTDRNRNLVIPSTMRTGERSLLDFKKSCSTSEFPNKFSRYLLDQGAIFTSKIDGYQVVTNSELAMQVAPFKQHAMMSRRADSAIGEAVDEKLLAAFEFKVRARVRELVTGAFLKSKVEFVREIARPLSLNLWSGLPGISPQEIVRAQFTTTNQICNNLFLIVSNPDIQLSLRDQPKLISAANDEFERFDPAVSFAYWVPKADQVLGPQTVSAGKKVLISNHALYRSQTIENPFRLDIRRSQNPKVAEIGQDAFQFFKKLERLQMNLIFEILLSETSFLSIDNDHGAHRAHFSLAHSGFSSIHLETF